MSPLVSPLVGALAQAPPDRPTAVMWVILAVLLISALGAINRRMERTKIKKRRSSTSGRRRRSSKGRSKAKSTKPAKASHADNPEAPAKRVPLGLEAIQNMNERLRAATKEASENGARARAVRTQSQKSSKKTGRNP